MYFRRVDRGKFARLVAVQHLSCLDVWCRCVDKQNGRSALFSAWGIKNFILKLLELYLPVVMVDVVDF